MMSESDRRRYAVIPNQFLVRASDSQNEPTLNDRFLKHLPNCPACRATIEYFERQSQINEYVHQSRN